MLAAVITIKNLDFEKTLEGIFPRLKQKLAEKESSNFLLRLFQRLDDEALPIALDILSRLPMETKTELAVKILNTYSIPIRDKMNEKLAEHPLGKHFYVGDVSIVERDGMLYLWLGRVKADYTNFAKDKLPIMSGVLGSIGGLAGALAGDRLEQAGLSMLWTEKNKQRAVDVAKNAIDQYGIAMELDDIVLMKESSEKANQIYKGTKLKLTAEMEEQLLDALAGYLKNTVNTPPDEQDVKDEENALEW